MEYWKEAYDIADIVLENSRLMWIVYVSFFILALMVRKKDNRTRRITGGVMIGAVAPGLLLSLWNLGLFIYAMIKVYQVAASKEYYIIDDSPVVKDIRMACNSIPVGCLTLSMFLFLILALVAVICGIVILANKAGKAMGVVTLVWGIGLIAFGFWFVNAMFTFFAA